jgi:hypothetical protein
MPLQPLRFQSAGAEGKAALDAPPELPAGPALCFIGEASNTRQFAIFF